MIVIYCCVTGVHDAQIAAGIHLGILQPDYGATRIQFKHMEGYNNYAYYQTGGIRVVGRDGSGRTVATLGVARDMDVVLETVNSLGRIWGKEKVDIHLVDVGRPYWKTMIWSLCHKLKLPNLGNCLMDGHIRGEFTRIAKLVEKYQSLD